MHRMVGMRCRPSCLSRRAALGRQGRAMFGQGAAAHSTIPATPAGPGTGPPVVAAARRRTRRGADHAGGSCTVPHDWAPIPSALPGDGKFRPPFITDHWHNAADFRISRYDTHVRYRAASGHSAIRPRASLFKAIGSTATVHARDHVEATGTGVPIYRPGGARVADNCGDFRGHPSGPGRGRRPYGCGVRQHGYPDAGGDAGARGCAAGPTRAGRSRTPFPGSARFGVRVTTSTPLGDSDAAAPPPAERRAAATEEVCVTRGSPLEYPPGRVYGTRNRDRRRLAEVRAASDGARSDRPGDRFGGETMMNTAKDALRATVRRALGLNGKVSEVCRSGGLTSGDDAAAIMVAGSPGRRVAGSPGRRVAGSPGRRVAGSPNLRLASALRHERARMAAAPLPSVLPA